ncbi:swr1 complex component [Mortierella alpina]|uniref:DNA helicase n=1 Tax=Mortierella alpina TaxID=64518 RepID=A0A9P6M5B0_MORAP|nr:swr1 complex component [Mortierella alpina]
MSLPSESPSFALPSAAAAAAAAASKTESDAADSARAFSPALSGAADSTPREDTVESPDQSHSAAVAPQAGPSSSQPDANASRGSHDITASPDPLSLHTASSSLANGETQRDLAASAASETGPLGSTSLPGLEAHGPALTNGHTAPNEDAPQAVDSTSSATARRPPGRPTRSQAANVATVKTEAADLPTRPRRTSRAVTASPTNSAPGTTEVSAARAQDIAAKGRSLSASSSSSSSPVVDIAGPAKAAGQRASSRHIRPPSKFVAESVLASTGRNNLPRATPSNQRALLDQRQQQAPEVPRKRGPGRPANSTLKQNLPAPQVIPLKRGPGRPPRNPLAVSSPAHLASSSIASPRIKSKSASPTMIRSSNLAVVNGSRSSSAVSTPKSPSSASSEPTVRRGPGRPPSSSAWKNSILTQTGAAPTSTRSKKRHIKSEAEDEERTATPCESNATDSGFTPRKRRVPSSQTPGVQSLMLAKNPEPPRPLTPLDRVREAKVTEWNGKMQEVIDHHDSLVRELYHLETTYSTLTYDPSKIKADHSEKMLLHLRKYDLKSQVPELVSSVRLSTDRISTRRSAIEHREQLVDMLQRNVEGALPLRADLSGSTAMTRVRPVRVNQPLFGSFEEYMSSFVYADDEEVTPEEFDHRAEAHARLLNRIDTLRAEGRLGGRPDKPFVDPEVPKLHYNWLMEHIMTSSKRIKDEKKHHLALARKTSKMIARHFELLHGKSEREQRVEEKRIRKLAKLTSNEVKKKWRYVEGIVRARHKAMLQEEQEEAGKRHLNLILEHSTQILEVQQSAFNAGTPGTSGASPATTPGTPKASLDTPILPGSPMEASPMPPASEEKRRRSSAIVLANPADAELDAGDIEFTLAGADADADDETTLANEESGSEDDEAEISGLAAEMDIPIEELLRQYGGYPFSADENSDVDEDENEDEPESSVSKDGTPDSGRRRESSALSSQPTDMDVSESTLRERPLKTEEDAEMNSASTLKDVLVEDSMDMEIDSETEKGQANDIHDTRGRRELPYVGTRSSLLDPEEDTPLSSKDIANALPDEIKRASKPVALSDRGHVSKRRRLSLTDLYRGPPLPWNPYGEVDDERTLEEEEHDDDESDPEEISVLLQEKDLPIEDLLDRYAYEAESSEYSDSYYDSDSEYEGMSIMSSQQRAQRADPRYVVTLQDVAASKKFPTRPSSEFTDTDTEYDDNRTISIYGSDDELCLGDMLPLLDPEVPPKSPEIDTFTTGANVKTRIPFLLRHQLREYQHVGMDWLAQLYSNGLNGILADEMGLGKTMQTIALLAHLACEYGVWGPHLIVVPTSVMLNWEMEFKKWCPGFKIMTYYGSPRERKEKRVGWSRENSFHVCITSYQLVVQDQTVFRRKAWQYLILDEAHNIKNFRSQRWQTLLNFNSARRLLLTGTPLQNNLMELWSLLYFLMPNGVSETMPVGFANQKEFQEWFSHPVDRMIEGSEQQDDESKAAIARLHTVLRPYLLRRLKADVETQMPAKYEHIVYCRLSKRQRFLYDDFMSRAKTRETLASGNFLSIINCLMQLRKVCNHPDLFEVRPIVTSFAMKPTAQSSFEITEFCVRRRMFADVDRARESANLEFLGLVFTGAEQRLSKMDLSALEELDAMRCFQDKAAGFALPQAKTLSSGNHYQDIRQYASMRRHQQVMASKHRWEQLGYVNANRCQVNVLYGSSLLRLCQAPTRTKRGCDTILSQASDPRQYLEYTNALAKAVVPSEDRFYQNQETIKRFAFVTPAVLVRDDAWAPIHVNPSPSDIELVCEKAQEVFYPVESCLQVQFPDKRLLQFDCGKLQKLDSLLRELKSGGHRALIFTQMTKVLDILEIFLNIHGHRYLRLDGATKVENRQHLTDRFNSDPKILAFILSTRSGGVGINLTGADTVIFYDSDWNPSMDRQCQDRCHRIGQTRDVHIYRFVSEFTIEENMLKKANQKRMLDNVVIQEGEFTTDYFQKMDWRDMLGEEDLAKIGDLAPAQANGEPRDLSTVQGADLEQALAAAEDENDVLAMQQAKHEMEGVDVGDFSETAAPAAGGTPAPTVQFAGSTAMDATEEGEVIEMGHVDEYMLRFMESEYGHYVGFGGLPKPEKKEDEVEVLSELEELEEQQEEDEEEEDEEGGDEDEDEDEEDEEEEDESDFGDEEGGSAAHQGTQTMNEDD